MSTQPSHLGKLMPDRNLVKYIYPDGVYHLNQIRQRQPRFQNQVADWCMWSMRLTLRLAHSLVMSRYNAYNREIKACRDNIALAFPSLEAITTKCFQWAVEPSSNSNEIIQFSREVSEVLKQEWL